MVISSAALIAIYIIALILVLKWPKKQHHPEDAMAVGCIAMCIAGLVLLGIVLAIGAKFHLAWIVRGIFYVTVVPAIISIPSLIVERMKTLKARAIARGVPIPADELVQRLAGHTHIMHYAGPEPRGQWREHRYYSPDGKLICYEEENGQLKRRDLDITWKVEQGYLLTIGDHHPGNQNAYQVTQTPDGQIAYYIRLPFSRLNGKLSRRTVEIREGAPVS